MPSAFPTLTVDLAAIAANYQLLKSKHAKRAIASVVKANAYGLGVDAISKRLWKEGCTQFFVATLEEAISLRAVLPDAEIAVFNGVAKGEGVEYIHHRITPVINDLAQIEYVNSLSTVIVHVDTGMTRLGLRSTDVAMLSEALINRCSMVISHLACANDPEHPQNGQQLERFRAALGTFPRAKACLTNSSGLFLPDAFHFDMGRPGCALYGINPVNETNPMQQVATLSAPILQIRTLDRDEHVGYGATHPAAKGAHIAIIGFGYADGWLRDLGNRGHAYIAGKKVPVVGRISMDMIALDVSTIPEQQLVDQRAEFINSQQTVDDIARECSSIGYEIFTRIGHRVKRHYI